MQRRDFLHGSGAGLGLLLLGCHEPEGDSADTADTADTAEPSPFATPLPIPPELHGTLVDGRVQFDLAARAGTTAFFPGQPTATKGYNGALLGPTLRVRAGDAVRMRVSNELDEETACHWHGAHVPAAADGGPHQRIAPGQTWIAEFTVDNKAATLWYHPHAMGLTASQVYAGMAGLLLVEDAESEALDLPRRYGIDDLPIVVQDRRFSADGGLEYELGTEDLHLGFQGDTFLVNGAIAPHVEAEAKQLRLRLLNGANGRTYRFALSDGTAFWLVGVDASLRESPLAMAAIALSPGERAEIVVDLTGREGEVLHLREEILGGDILELRVVDATALTALPDRLATLEHLAEADAVRTRTFILAMMGGGFTINNVAMDMDTINEVVPVGEVEIWEVRNASMMPHNFHMHGTHFEILRRGDDPPPEHERGYKDVVFLDVSERVTLLVRHTDYTDATQPYMYHCHILEHEDHGMMGQFTVVEA